MDVIRLKISGSMNSIASAQELFENDDSQWKAVLAFGLDEIGRGLSLHWAGVCFPLLLIARYPDRVAEIEDELRDAAFALHSMPVSSDLDEKSIEIWYRPVHDPAQHALSKLFWGIHEYHTGGNCSRSASAVISNLFRVDKFTRPCSRSTARMMFDATIQNYESVQNGLRFSGHSGG